MRRRRRAAGLALALGVMAAPALGADAVDGKAVYEIRCAPCHGDSGEGNGPAAAALEPKPRNFRDAAFWRGRSRTSLKLVVEQGRPGTMMAPFKGVLSDAEIDGVVRYVESFRPAQ
jgi:high-affinity iron transporter